MVTLKHCIRCGQNKNSIEFYNNRTQKDGKSCYCKICQDGCSREYKDRKHNDLISQLKDFGFNY